TQEAARALRPYQERLVADPERLSQVEARLEQIARLKAKYGSTVEEILAFAEEAQRELDAVVNSSASLAQLEKELAGIEQELAEKALELSAARREVAREAAAEIGRRLALLNMPHARFEVAFSVEEDPEGIECGGRRLAVSRKGIDRVEFLFSANPGESLKPLARIASGGEMSRVALAIKTVMAGADPVPTLVFDEVDAGIGGETAERVADALVQLAASRQVLVVTHLAQIAARADRHLNVVKSSDGLRTTVSVRPLDGEERVWEIARMLDGQATATSFDHARALLDMARRAKTAS
ncbi:MAG: DNA repair protein RecN, partial [Clostridia bacterium]